VRRDVQLAHFYVSDAGRFVGETAIQLHGAIGMSEELPVSRLYKRLLATEFRHGDGLLQAQRLTTALRSHALTVT
jgi:alkylation response protein AidB-like acyl-CoA dehydrogenase